MGGQTGEMEGLAATFETVAEQYERSRPGYPDALFADLAHLAGMGPAADVLEIGAGTGQATRSLRARGWRVLALEPGRELARLAGEPTVVSRFEDWDGTGPFDLVFAATSWHWLDQDVAFAKAAGLLRQGGSLAIVSTHHVLPADGDPFFRAVQADYEAAGLGDGSGGPPPPDEVADPPVEPTGLFAKPEVRRYVTATTYSADDYLALIGTYSNHIAATPEQKDRLYAAIRRRIGPGTVRKHHLNILHVSRLG